MTSYYHWTDEETYKQIIRKSNIFQSFMTWFFGFEPHDLVPGSGGRDEYGPGVYFTDSGPDLARSTIAGRCFGHSSNQDQVQCYFLVDFHGNAKIDKERAHVWKLSPKSKATQTLLDHGYHPDFDGNDDDDDDDDDDWVPSCNKCGDSSDVSDPGGDYYWCDHCEHDIDEDGDCMSDPCPTCDDDDDDDYDDAGRVIEVSIYKGNFAPNPSDTKINSREDLERYAAQHGAIITGKGYTDSANNSDKCSNCNEYLAAKDCAYGECGNCCDGNGCARHGDGDDDDDDDDWVPTCNGCGDSNDVVDPGGDYYWCNYCECDIDSDGDEV